MWSISHRCAADTPRLSRAQELQRIEGVREGLRTAASRSLIKIAVEMSPLDGPAPIRDTEPKPGEGARAAATSGIGLSCQSRRVTAHLLTISPNVHSGAGESVHAVREGSPGVHRGGEKGKGAARPQKHAARRAAGTATRKGESRRRGRRAGASAHARILMRPSQL